MHRTIKLKAILAVAGAALSVGSAFAQNASYDQAAGDIVLFFEQYGGSQTIMVNIGTGQSFRDATSNMTAIKNLGTELTANFGATWYDNADLYWGVAGVRSNSTGTTTQVNGDPNRTLYVSQERTAVGTVGSASSVGWSGFANSDMTTGANGIIAMTNRMETVATTDRLIEGIGTSNVDNQNPFLGSSPGTAFGIFPGGVMGNFGAGSFGTLGGYSSESALDLYRILASTTATGQVSGPLREGSYEGSFVIDSSGDISFVAVPEPSTAFVLLAGLGSLAFFRRRRCC